MEPNNIRRIKPLQATSLSPDHPCHYIYLVGVMDHHNGTAAAHVHLMTENKQSQVEGDVIIKGDDYKKYNENKEYIWEHLSNNVQGVNGQLLYITE